LKTARRGPEEERDKGGWSMKRTGQKRNDLVTCDDSYWNKLIEGVNEHGSPQERAAVLAAARCLNLYDFFHRADNLPSQIGHGRMKHLPKALRRN